MNPPLITAPVDGTELCGTCLVGLLLMTASLNVEKSVWEDVCLASFFAFFSLKNNFNCRFFDIEYGKRSQGTASALFPGI
jgi:hypothetical protein